MDVINPLAAEASVYRDRAAQNSNPSVFRFDQRHVRVLHSGEDVELFLCHPCLISRLQLHIVLNGRRAKSAPFPQSLPFVQQVNRQYRLVYTVSD
jgi:hypothetical protein